EDVFLRAVVNDLVNELGPEERFAAHQRKDARADGMEPINRAARYVFGHALDLVVVRPAVVTIVVALPLGEQVRDDRAQLAAMIERFEVGRTPSLPRADGVEFLI